MQSTCHKSFLILKSKNREPLPVVHILRLFYTLRRLIAQALAKIFGKPHVIEILISSSHYQSLPLRSISPSLTGSLTLRPEVSYRTTVGMKPRMSESPVPPLRHLGTVLRP